MSRLPIGPSARLNPPTLVGPLQAHTLGLAALKTACFAFVRQRLGLARLLQQRQYPQLRARCPAVVAELLTAVVKG